MTSCRSRSLALPAVLCASALLLTGSVARPDDALDAGRILDASGVHGGLIIHLHCGDGRLTAALGADERYVVRGLDPDPHFVETARKHIRSHGCYGRVSADSFDGRRLPLVDNLVNLVVAETLGDVPLEEILRVLAPGGSLCLKNAGVWTTTVKPWPGNIDEWTHFQHGPDNNAVADDDVVGPPRHMQWLAGPTWTRHHHADKGTDPAIRAVVSSHGRLFYTVDETESSVRRVPASWFLAARDAFSGVLLWKVPLLTSTFDGRLERVWRELIADGDEVYAQLGADQPLSALEAATGAVIRHYEGTNDLHEVIKYQDTLLVITGLDVLLAFDVATGKPLWQWDPADEGPIVPLTLAADDGRVFIRTDQSIRCFSIAEGKTLWRFVPEGAGKRTKLKWPREKLLVKDGVVLASYGGKDPAVLNRDKYEYLGSHPRVHDYDAKLAALSAADGTPLWNTEYLPGLESMPGEIYVSAGLVWLGPDFSSPRDLHTGKVKWTRPLLEDLWTAGHHYRCYPGKATRNYILTAKRGIEMFDLTGENHTRDNWVRGTCRVGVTPCNGLIYAPSHSCGCYMEAKLFGFWALAPGDGAEGTKWIDDDTRLHKGPYYNRLETPQHAATATTDWPTYRGDSARSGSTESRLPSALDQRWRADLGGPLSAITVAGGKLFVTRIDAHTVHALDAATGKSLWQFTAGGRVDSPPTIHAGLALFGSRDGRVYCLRAADGQLLWQFQAAPQTTSAVAYEQVESLWPVHGSVLVHGGIAYVAAGRSSYLDGGIVLYGLEPSTGRIVAKTQLASQHAEVLTPPSQEKREEMDHLFSQNQTDYKTFLAPDKSDAFSMAGALTDVMTADDDSIFMRQLRFDRSLTEQQDKRPHLFSTSSLLDGREHNRAYWAFGTADFSRTPVAYPWIVSKSMAVPYGVMLAFDENTVWGVRREGKNDDAYAVFASPRPDPAAKESLLPDFAERSGKKLPLQEHWVVDTAIRPRAIIQAGDRLVLGGMVNQFDPNDLNAPINTTYAGNGVGLLQVLSTVDGKKLADLQLEAPPVWDGITAAQNQLFIATGAGTVLCFGQ